MSKGRQIGSLRELLARWAIEHRDEYQAWRWRFFFNDGELQALKWLVQEAKLSVEELQLLSEEERSNLLVLTRDIRAAACCRKTTPSESKNPPHSP